MSTLNFVVGDYHAPRWGAERIHSDDLLVQFHDKFWDVSMNKEVKNWRESAQNKDYDEHEEEEGNSEEEGDDADANKGEQANEEEGEDDEDENGGDKDNIIDGCYALDVNIPEMETSIWVRAEYIRIFDHIAKLY